MTTHGLQLRVEVHSEDRNLKAQHRLSFLRLLQEVAVWVVLVGDLCSVLETGGRDRASAGPMARNHC